MHCVFLHAWCSNSDVHHRTYMFVPLFRRGTKFDIQRTVHRDIFL